MSYDIDYINPETNEPFEIEKHSEGGTIQVGGCPTTELKVTYNYGWFFRNHLDKRRGIRWLYGKTGEQVIPRLEKAVNTLGTNKFMRTDQNKVRAYRRECQLNGDTPDLFVEFRDEYRYFDYWAPTPGNAGHALNTLLEWAKKFPQGVFSGD